MGLLRLPLFATSGGRGKPPGINAKPPVYVIPKGVSLAATLRLSWQRAADLGMPVWEGADRGLLKTAHVPLLAGLTWLPRLVWLDDPGEPEADCISCGRRESLIRQCVFAGIGSTRTDSGEPARIWRDPHVLYTTSAKGDLSLHARDALGTPDAAAGQWGKTLAEMLRKQNAPGAPPPSIPDCLAAGGNAWVVGFSTVQNDKYLEATESVVPFHSSVAIEQIQGSIEKTERWQKEGSKLASKAKPRKGRAGSRKHVEIRSLVDAIRPHVEGRVFATVTGLSLMAATRGNGQPMSITR